MNALQLDPLVAEACDWQYNHDNFALATYSYIAWLRWHKILHHQSYYSFSQVKLWTNYNINRLTKLNYTTVN